MAEDVNVSQRKFAQHIGKTHVWVNTLVKDGKLPSNEDGSIPLRKGLEAYQGLQENKKNNASLPDANDAISIGMSYNKAKAAKETYTAQIRQLELKQKRGELVEKKEVEMMAINLAEKVRSKLMSVGVRVSGLCEGRTAREIEEIIETEINSAIADLHKEWFKTD